MILCAGLGTRLRPLTDWLAKPMVPIGDKPAVEHIAARIRAHEWTSPFDRVVVNVHHRPDDVRSWAEKAGVLVSDERHALLGTAGGVAHARGHLFGEGEDGDVLVWNGDILSDLDLDALLAAHESARSEATLAVTLRAAGDGNVGIGENNQVVRLRSSSFGGARREREIHGADFIGIHVLGAAMRKTLPESGCLVADVWIPALRSGASIATHVVTSAFAFTDIGSIGSYVAANRAWLATQNAAAWAAADAALSPNVRIDGSIISSTATVEADAIRCIVWPGARIVEPIEDAIVTPHGRVKVSSTLSSSS